MCKVYKLDQLMKKLNHINWRMVDILIEPSRDSLFSWNKDNIKFLIWKNISEFNVFGIFISVDITFKSVSDNTRQIIII